MVNDAVATPGIWYHNIGKYSRLTSDPLLKVNLLAPIL